LAERFGNIWKKLRTTHDFPSLPSDLPQNNLMLVMDRTTDPITPLLTQLTYSGLLDQIKGIQAGAQGFSFACNSSLYSKCNLR
jgi:hypothetical protein